jgi:hypothetical protein
MQRENKRVVGSGERTSSSSSSSSRKNLAQYSTISCKKKEAILDSGLRGPLKPPVGLELLNCESSDDNKTRRYAGDAQCKKLQQQPQCTNAQCRAASHVLACTCAAARRLYFNCLFFRLAIIGICLIERLLGIVFFSFLRANFFQIGDILNSFDFFSRQIRSQVPADSQKYTTFSVCFHIF